MTIIGSGLSCAEGMPGMAAIADQLIDRMSSLIDPADQDAWATIQTDMQVVGLEAALLKTQPSPSLENLIVAEVAAFLLPREQKILEEAISGRRILAVSRLFGHLLKPASGIPVVTTNYDRLIEFAAEQAGLGVDTMFVGSYSGSLNENESNLSFLRDVKLRGKLVHYRYRDRIRLFKPHGSFDWFLGPNGPIRYCGDLSLSRHIITPGLNKFRSGYDSPFDKHRERANAAIDQASRFLIVGYGFNDDHLETHLKPMLRAGKPALLITMEVSNGARAIQASCPNFTSLEYGKEGGKEGTLLFLGASRHFFPDLDIWRLERFISEVLEP